MSKAKGLSFDQLFPGTYLRAGEFDGRAVTLTVKSVKREMLSNGAGGEEGAVTVSFAETEKQWVMNKTCGVCLRAMWGDDSGEWIGHRITLHPVKDESGLSESGFCIRVKGSPELDKELKFRARLGRKMVSQTLVPTKAGQAPTVAPASAPDDAEPVEGTVGLPETEDAAAGPSEDDSDIEFGDGAPADENLDADDEAFLAATAQVEVPEKMAARARGSKATTQQRKTLAELYEKLEAAGAKPRQIVSATYGSDDPAGLDKAQAFAAIKTLEAIASTAGQGALV